MFPLKRHILVKAIFLLSKIGAHRASLAYTDQLLHSNLSLSQLRKAVENASSRSDHETILRLSSYAIEKYPSNSFGYIEKANILAAQGDIEHAISTLKKAPSCRPISETLESLKKTPAKVIKPKEKNKQKDTFQELPSDLENNLIQAGNEPSLLSLIVEQANEAIKSNPKNLTNYSILTRTYNQLKEYKCLIEAINSFPTAVSSRLNYRLMLVQAYQHLRDQETAFNTLIAAQVDHPSERKLLMRISDMLRDDAQVPRAYSYLCAGQALYPAYGSVKRLSFEIDHFLYDEARGTLLSILEFPREVIMKFMPMINRATPFFPDIKEKIQAARNSSRELLAAEKGRKGINPNAQLKVAIKCRWLHEAQRIISRNKAGSQPVSLENQQWLTAVIQNIGPARALVEIASSNETSSNLHGLHRGSIIDIEFSKIPPEKIVEVFIPTVFFAAPDEEKPSYSTVREFLSNVYSYLLSRQDLILVPRHQWNWRNCDPSIPGARIVSYHTNATYNPMHLHIQEVPLAGRCSMDHQGFAGYSSLATNHKQIESASIGISREALAKTEEHLHEAYVTNNVSKYSQTQDRITFDDDYVFVALQIPTDTVAALAYINGVDLIQTVAEHFANTSTKVRVKRHPYCNSMTVQRTLAELSKNGKIDVSDASVHDLISGARAVFTVNSGVGLEALLHGRPVVVTGECDYSYAVVANPRSVSELREFLNNNEFKFDSLRTQKLLHYYVNSYSMAAHDAAAINAKLESWLSLN